MSSKKYRLGIAGRLMLAPATALLLLTGLALAAYQGIQTQRHVMNEVLATRSATYQKIGQFERDSSATHTSTYRMLSLANAGVAADTLNETGAQAIARLASAFVGLGNLAVDPQVLPEEKALLTQATADMKDYQESVSAVADLVTSDVPMAMIIMGQADARFITLNQTLDALLDLENRISGEAFIDAEKSSTWVIRMLLAVVAASMVLQVLVTMWVHRGLVGQLGGEPAVAAEIATRVARGDLPLDINVKKGDTRSIIYALHSMVQRLRAFVAAESEMARRHAAGDVAGEMPVHEFEGAYRDMAQSINDLAASHIGVQQKIVAVMSDYGRGIFSKDMETLPGRQREISDAVALVKTNLQAVNGEIFKLVESAGKGDFTARGTAGRFEADFRKMIDGLNHLMQISDAGLNEVVRVLGALAAGDLTERMEGDFEGSFAQLQAYANRTGERLRAIVAEIRDASDSVNGAAREIATGNADLSSRTEVQAANIEDTAARMETLTGNVQKNADNAREANRLVISASALATRGGGVVQQVVETMQSIDAASRKIVAIIAVIDDIAFQTNILALNAAIEAARAGDQGKGFAVVATEVRSLAHRSSVAAKEIAALIEDSVKRVSMGSELANAAGSSMNEIVESVGHVTRIMADITAAAAEQSVDIEQVNGTISNMDNATRQNATLVQQAAAAAATMEDQAGTLERSVGMFKTGATARATGPVDTAAAGTDAREAQLA
jgi:methyl-accepting chemotaxis protein